MIHDLALPICLVACASLLSWVSLVALGRVLDRLPTHPVERLPTAPPAADPPPQPDEKQRAKLAAQSARIVVLEQELDFAQRRVEALESGGDLRMEIIRGELATSQDGALRRLLKDELAVLELRGMR